MKKKEKSRSTTIAVALAVPEGIICCTPNSVPISMVGDIDAIVAFTCGGRIHAF